jgi:ribose transport system substrate-binding protein
VLRAFRFEGETLPLRDVVERSGLSKSTVYRLLCSLQEGQLIERTAADRYRSRVKPVAGRGLRLGFAGRISAFPFAQEVTASLRQAAEREGADLLTLDNGRGSQKALRNAEKLVQARVELAILYQPNEDVASQISARLAQADIPVIAVAFPHPGAVYYGANNYQAGLIGGRALGRWANQNWKGRVEEVILMGLREPSSVLQSRLAGLETGIRETLPAVEQYRVVSLDSGTFFGQSLAAVRRHLRFNSPRRTLIGSINDAAAIGAIRAFEEAGRANLCAAVGEGAAIDGREELRRSGTRLIGSVAFFPDKFGQNLLSLAHKMVTKKVVPPAVFVQHQLVTRENVNELYPDDPRRSQAEVESLLWQRA